MSSGEKKELQEQTRLARLKENNEIRSLLKEYHKLADTEESDISPVLKSYAFGLLFEKLDEVKHILTSADSLIKEYAIEFLRDVDNAESLLFLAGCLMREENIDIQSRIKDVLITSEKLEEIRDFFYDSIEFTFGRRFEILSEIIGYINNPYFLKAILLKLKQKCPLGNEICGKDFTPLNSFFVGHYFSKEMIDDLRPHINAAISEVMRDCAPYYADDDLGEDLLCKICQKIQSTKFGIYDISVEHGKVSPNPNVMLEIGMSLAFGKKTILIMKNNPVLSVPADLRGKVIIFYDSLKDLEKSLIKLLPRELGLIALISR